MTATLAHAGIYNSRQVQMIETDTDKPFEIDGWELLDPWIVVIDGAERVNVNPYQNADGRWCWMFVEKG